MTKKTTIAVDVDEVLANHYQSFAAFSREVVGVDVQPKNFSENWTKTWGLSSVEEARSYYHQFLTYEWFIKFDRIAGSLEVLKELKKQFKLIAITSRGEILEEVTRDWIAQNLPKIFEKVYFSKIYDREHVSRKEMFKAHKGGLLAELGVDCLVDDQLKHCLGAAEHGVQALLFGDYDWNHAEQLPSGVTRVSNWAEVENYFNERF